MNAILYFSNPISGRFGSKTGCRAVRVDQHNMAVTVKRMSHCAAKACGVNCPF
jgi:hypothetical protein